MDIMTEAQLLALIFCAVLSLVAYRCRIPSLAIVPAIGFLILGFQIFETSQDGLLLMLFFITAVGQFVLCFRNDGRR